MIQFYQLRKLFWSFYFQKLTQKMTKNEGGWRSEVTAQNRLIQFTLNWPKKAGIEQHRDRTKAPTTKLDNHKVVQRSPTPHLSSKTIYKLECPGDKGGCTQKTVDTHCKDLQNQLYWVIFYSHIDSDQSLNPTGRSRHFLSPRLYAWLCKDAQVLPYTCTARHHAQRLEEEAHMNEPAGTWISSDLQLT